jgi:hypothetical protein
MTDEERKARYRGSGFAEAQDAECVKEAERRAEEMSAEGELKAQRHDEQMRAAIQSTTIQPAEWLPYKLRDRLNLFEAACLLCRQDPERLVLAVHDERHQYEIKLHGTSAPIRTRAGHVAELIAAMPEVMLGEHVGGTVKALQKATAAPLLQSSFDVVRLRAVAEGLGIEWPPELDSPRAPTQPAPSTIAPAVAIPEPVVRPQQRQRHQEAEILRVLRELGHDPNALPRNTPGRAGPKAAAFGRLGWKKEARGVFDKAWDRLRLAREIADA